VTETGRDSRVIFDEVIEINAEVVRKFGGIHDFGTAEPRNPWWGGYHAHAIEEAAVLFESLRGCRKIICFWMEISVRLSRPSAFPSTG
jgi:hypothetical protein